MSRKGENIYKRKDGRWEGRFITMHTPNGKSKYKSVYGKTYREVKQKLQDQKYLQETAKTTITTAKNVKYLSDVLSEWIEKVRPNLKESSYVKYCNQIELHIRPLIGGLELSAITTTAIQEYAYHLMTEGSTNGNLLSPKSISGILSILKRVFRYADNLYSKVNCDISQISLRQNEPQLTVLTLQEQEKLCSSLLESPSPMHAGILLALYTGLRIGVLCALKWSNISLDDHFLFVKHSMQRLQNMCKTGSRTRILISPPKSSSSIRTIPLPDFLTTYLNQFQTDDGEAYLLTGTARFVEPRTVQNHFKRLLGKTGIRSINFHSLRHTFATRCIESGFDIKSLSEILGHASVNITLNRYVHPSPELKKANMEKLSALFPVK